jgi:hypothetical protein
MVHNSVFAVGVKSSIFAEIVFHSLERGSAKSNEKASQVDPSLLCIALNG